MKKLLSFLLCLACVSSAAMLMSCQGDTPDETIDESKDPVIEQPDEKPAKDAEVALFSGDSEIRLIPANNSLKVTYLATKASGKSLVAENSEYALPKQLDGTTSSGKVVKFKWNYIDREDLSFTENGVEITGYKFIYEDSTGIAGLEVSCLARESLNGPFEFRMNLINKSTEDGIYLMPYSFASMSFDNLADDASLFYVAKESGVAENYLWRDQKTFFEGSGIYEIPVSDNDETIAWVTTTNSFNKSGYLPMIYVKNGAKNGGVYAALEWSSGRVIAANDDTSVTLSIDMDEISSSGGEFVTKVSTGDTFEFPNVYYGVYDGSLDNGSNTFKAWFFDCKAPARLRDNANEPLVQNDHQWVVAEAEKRGLESIKWDIGWWTVGGHVPGDAVDWGWLDGSWELRNPMHIEMINREGCNTLPEFTQYLREKGINLTTYVLLHDTLDGPNLPNKTPTDAYGEFNSITHPDWFSTTPVYGIGMAADLGNEECVEYLKKAMADLFNNNGIGTWRSDFEPIICDSHLENRHMSNGTDVMYWCTVGFRDLVEHLYANVENFRYESCSSGGSMKDLFTSTLATGINCDDSANYMSLRTTFYDSSYVIHPSQLMMTPWGFEGWPVVEFDPVYNTDTPHETQKMVIRTAIMGHVAVANGGYDSDIDAEHYAIYKEKIRPLVRDGELYHILPRPDGTNWDGMMYADPDSANETKGVVFLFKPNKDVESTKRIVMDGLDENKSYELTFKDRPEQNKTVSGKVLMEEGIDVEILGVGSEMIFITEAE